MRERIYGHRKLCKHWLEYRKELVKVRIDYVRKMYLEMKVRKRIEANRIVGYIGFRDHFSSHPGRHSWDLCGHPVYWWILKAAVNTKYLEKILLYTEVEQAWKDAKEMSDKFVIWKRSIEECKEPAWKFMDDLKSSKSRINMWKIWDRRDEEMRELLGFEPTLEVFYSANQPLVRAESCTRVIERYFEDDIAEMAVMATRILHPNLHIRHPEYPEYLLPMIEFGTFRARQERPESYDVFGVSIAPYKHRVHGMMERIVYVEVGEDERLDLHDEEDLELARFKMRRRLDRKKDG